MPRTSRALALLLSLALASCEGAGRDTLFELRGPDETGIDFANVLVEDDSVYNALDFDYLYNGAGVGVGDVDNDGLPDVFLAGNMVSSRLYLNRGGLRFEDVTDAAGVGTDAWITGVAMADVNQDGWLDVYLSVAGPGPEARRANLLFVNQGPGPDGRVTFVECAAQYGLDDTGYSTHAAFLDYDGDGDLDVYLLTNSLEEFDRNRIRPKLIDGEGSSTDRLYRNEGDGTFTDVSRAAGIVVEGYGLGVAVSDLNDDGWPDVYVSNDFITNDLVWINQRDGTFADRVADYLKHQTHNGMGVDVADFDNDGLVDIVVLDMLPPDNLREKTMVQTSNYDRFHMSLRLGYQPQVMRNTLQRNNGPGPDGEPTFSEIGRLAGVSGTDWSWAPLLADLDNDGRKDLFVTNGYGPDVTNLDYVVYLQEGSRAGPPEERRRRQLEGLRALGEVRLASYGFRNQGDLTFTDRTREWGLDVAAISHGAAWADLDGDGDLDLVVNNLGEPAFLFENRSERLGGHHSLRLALEGPPGNLAGLGTRVVVYAPAGTQSVEQFPHRGYVSSVEPVLHVGLGRDTRVDSVEVRWPDGARQLLKGVGADQVLTLAHGEASRAGTPSRVATPGDGAAADPPGAPPLFRAAGDVHGLAYQHREREIVDYKVQPLLPHQLSRGGPGLAVGDVDGNGLDDVYVGADRGSGKGIFLQVAPGRFERRALEGAEDYEDVGALVFDADGDGHLDLYVVSGGSFLASDPAAYQDRLYVNDGRGGLSLDGDALPEVTASGSAVVGADFDRDGDLDLFVGGKVVPGRYPEPPRSHLLRNDSRPGGPARFTDVTDSVAPGLAHAGMVSSALWTDFDQDGLVDLLLVGEWMGLTLFRNEGARLVDVSASVGLGATEGWWNSAVAADIDDDGDTDYLVGNLGLNSRYRASEQEPVRVHAGDFDGNGSLDPVVSRYVQGRSHPVAPRDQMIDQMIGMKGRFPRFADYGRATLEETLSAAELEGALVLRSVTMASAYVENLGGGRLSLRPLPLGAQVSPIFGMLPGDFDGDGHLDVAVAGNSYAEDTREGWHDASIGGVLLGDGAGGFRWSSGSESGFFVDGDAKGVAELALDDGQALVLVTQNDDRLLAFTATSPTPGRRVRVRPLDAWALLTLADGRTRRHELHHGSTYLSQSSRTLVLPPGVREAVVYDSRGRSRTLLTDEPDDGGR